MIRPWVVTLALATSFTACLPELRVGPTTQDTGTDNDATEAGGIDAISGPEAGPDRPDIIITPVDSGRSNGSACQTGSECGSGFCVDGVCCNNACSGLCERCDISSSVGMCSPVPSGSDPDFECDPFGAPTTTSDGGVSDSGMSDATSDVASDAVAPPPMRVRSACGGLCDGARMCRFPDNTTRCAPANCTNSTTSNTPKCNGTGRCVDSTSSCTNNLACGSMTGQCPMFCGSSRDCTTGFFCEGTSQACRPRKGNGITCTSSDECSSNFCVNGLCCNTACADPLSCNAPGMAGTCSCGSTGLNCPMGCRVFYKDFDGDTFGDRNGNSAMMTAVAGCVGANPPVGFVTNNDDCDDRDARAKPGQAQFFDTARLGVGGFDFNCDGSETEQYSEYPGARCGFCNTGPTNNVCPSPATTCSVSSQQAQLSCPLGSSFCFPAGSCACCGCNNFFFGSLPATEGFTTSLRCGEIGTYAQCSTCFSTGGSVGTSGPSRRQACR